MTYHQKRRKELVELLEFFYCLSEVVSFLKIKYGNTNNINNILMVNFIKLFDWCRSCLASQFKDYGQSLTDYVFWQSREFYLESMVEFVAGNQYSLSLYSV